MTRTVNFYDVIVVGGGPSGSQVADKLAEMGHSVGVVERKETLSGNVCCAGLVSHECVEKYSIPESVIYRWANSARLFTPSGKLVRIQRNEPQVAVLNRTAFNQIWAARAQKTGAEYLFGCKLKGIVREKSIVTAEVSRREKVLNLKSRAIVIATGFGTQLLDNLGLGGAGDFVMGAQAEVKTNDVNELEVYFGSEIAPEFFAWLVPTSPGKALVGLLARRNSPFYLRKLLASLAEGGKITSAEVKLTYGGVPLKPLPHTHSDNLLVVGTAAGQVKPITGGGIYFGLICADIAANTPHRALETANLSASGLAGYERAWRKKLARELMTGYWARKAYEMLSDRQVDRIFGLLESTGLIEELCHTEELSFDWHANVIAKVMGQKLFATAINSVRESFNRKKQTDNIKKKR
jgi:digeranylgeranylglycerophospholipid reductase